MKKRARIIGASGNLGQYMADRVLARGYEVVGVGRPESVGTLDRFGSCIAIFPGRTNDRAVVERALKGCEGVDAVLVPWGVEGYAAGTAQAVLGFAEPGARLVFSCGWRIGRDGRGVYTWRHRLLVGVFGRLARLFGFGDLDDQVEACRRDFASETAWTVVRGSDLEEGAVEGLPVWSRHVGETVLASNQTRRTDFVLFLGDALSDDSLIHEAPDIVSCQSASARAHMCRVASGTRGELPG